MARAARTAPRRLPRQERAQDTVEVILQAAALVLARDGHERASTNHIAQAAGVSIGSLYRYFPSKEALLGALYRRFSAETLPKLEQTFAAMRGAPLSQAVRAIVQAEFHAHAGNTPLHQILFEQIPHAGARAHLDQVRERFVALVRQELASRGDEVRALDLDQAAFILVHTIHTLSHEALRHRPAYLSDEGYLNECVALVLRYLQAEAPARAPG